MVARCLGVEPARPPTSDDPNVFFGTTVTVPNSVARQQAAGFEFRLAAAPRHGWSGSLSYSHARVVQFGPVTGGLFLEDEVAAIQDGTRFIPDHDQRHALAATASFAHAPKRLRASGTLRYQTGTPVGIEEDDVEELRDRPGSETVDFESGRVKPRTVLDLLASWTLTHGGRVDADDHVVDEQRDESDLRLQLRQSVQRHALRGRAGEPACRSASGSVSGAERRVAARQCSFHSANRVAVPLGRLIWRNCRDDARSAPIARRARFHRRLASGVTVRNN